MCGHCRCQQREILILAHATGDQHGTTAQALQGGHRGTDIGALAVVDVLDAIDHRDRFAAVVIGHEGTQRMQHGAHRHIAGAQQRQCRQHVGMVVGALHAQCVGRHQAVEHEIHGLGLATTATGNLFRQGFGQPRQTALTHQTESRCGMRGVQREIGTRRQHGHLDLGLGARAPLGRLGSLGLGRHLPRRGQVRIGQRVVEIDDTALCCRVDAQLGSPVVFHRAMPVQMVWRDVEHHGRLAGRWLRHGQLEAGQLQRPQPRHGGSSRTGRQALGR